MLQELIETFEELKKYVFIIDRGNNNMLVIRFNNDNFYHLVGLHKTNINMFFPNYLKTQDKKYKYLKKNVNKFDNILKNQIKDKNLLELRIKTFVRIKELLSGENNTILYNFKEKIPGSLYNGDYGLMKVFEDNIFCLLGLKKVLENDNIITCAPQSWMASNRTNRIIENKRPIYMNKIIAIPSYLYTQDENLITN